MFTKFNADGYRPIFPGIHLKTLTLGEKTHLTHVRLEQGVRLPDHSHPHEQTGYLISGRMRFIIGGESFDAEPGDSWCIPGGVPHSAEVLEDTLVIEVFSPIREDYLAGQP